MSVSDRSSLLRSNRTWDENSYKNIFIVSTLRCCADFFTVSVCLSAGAGILYLTGTDNDLITTITIIGIMALSIGSVAVVHEKCNKFFNVEDQEESFPPFFLPDPV